jgi:hypothetical protein
VELTEQLIIDFVFVITKSQKANYFIFDSNFSIAKWLKEHFMEFHHYYFSNQAAAALL